VESKFTVSEELAQLLGVASMIYLPRAARLRKK
jgi:hypothetical protein